MKCPKCNDPRLYLVAVKYNETQDEKYRKFTCPACGETVYTVEFPVEKTESFEGDWDEASSVY